MLVLSGGGATIFDLFLLAELKWVESTILEGFSQAKQQGKLLYFPPSSNSSNWVAQYENISVLFIGIIECLADHDLTAQPLGKNHRSYRFCWNVICKGN